MHSTATKLGFGAFFIFVCLIIFGSCLIGYVEGPSYDNVQLVNKERVTVSNGEDVSSEFRIWVNDAQGKTHSLKITDKLVGGMRTNSSDVYGSLVIDGCYDITSRGQRISIASAFPNVETINKVECNKSNTK